MAAQTKMIIITTDEDIIRQFSLKQSTNTKIINLENDSEQILSQNNDDDIVNLPFLAELSKLNSTSDHVYKRALDSDDHLSSKPVKTSRRSIDMTCVICGDKAIGYNYDVLSCASCKAFFRRNAFKSLDKLRCLSHQGQCSVTHDTRRKCQRCRLERCFAVGMRKDFIISEEEKQRKKFVLEQNRTMTTLAHTEDELDRILTDINDENTPLELFDDVLFNTLSIENWLIVENIRTLFLAHFKSDITKHPTFDCSDKTTALINWSYIVHENALTFINFFREITEFQDLDCDDRLILIKYNLFPIYPVVKCFYHDKHQDCWKNVNTEEILRRRRFFTYCFGSDSDNTRQRYMSVFESLTNISERDPAVLGLILIILMFYQGLSMNDNEPPLKDTLQVNRSQSHYVNVLWNYLVHKWGETETQKRFSQLILVIFRMQIVSKSFRDFFCNQVRISNAADKIAPLMQTVLHIA